MRDDPARDLERLQLAALPAYSAFAFFFCSQVTIAVAMQLASVPFGLMYAEVFLFALPAVLIVRSANWRAFTLLKLQRPAKGLIALGFFTGAANFLLAGSLQNAVRAVLPESLLRSFDSSHLFVGASDFETTMVLVAIAAFAPLCEELVFRGYLQTVLRARVGVSRAVGICALLFAVLHVDPVGLLARVELGVLFSVLVLWSGSLWPAIAAHAVHNLIGGLGMVVATRWPPPPGDGPTGLVLQMWLAFASAVAVLALLVTFRRMAVRSRSREPALAPVDPMVAEHLPRLSPVADLARVWVGLAAACAVVLLSVEWRSLQVNLVDAAVPLSELKHRLPDDATRKAFVARMAAERHRACDGAVELEKYRTLRKSLAQLKEPAATLAEIDRVLHEADPGAP